MRFYVIIFAVVFISLGSCTKEDRKLLIIKQEAAIDQYVQNLSCDTVLYQNGVVRAILERGKPSMQQILLQKEIQSVSITPDIFFQMGKERYFIPIQTVWLLPTTERFRKIRPCYAQAP